MATLAQNAPVEQTALITVPFHGNNLFIVNHNNEPYTPMKPIVEGMGLDWAAQFTKLKQRFASTIVEIAMVANDGKERLMTCLPLRKLFGWLNSISPNKVNPEIRDTVIMYQNECDDALYAYWTKGVDINPHATQQALPTPPTNLHLALTKTIKAIGKGSRQNYSTLYTRVYDKFQVNSYKELTVEQCQAAIEFVKSVEGEFIGRDKIAAPKDKINDGEHYFVVKDGVVLWEKTLKSHCDDIPENVIQNPALMLEHIRQVVGEFVGKGALPAPKPSLDINYPAITARPPKSFNANQHWFKADDFVDGNFDPVRDFLIGLETAGYEVTGLQIINQAKTWVIQQQAKAIKQIDKGYRYIG